MTFGSLPSTGAFNSQTGGFPFGKAVFQATYLEALGAKHGDSFEGQNAVGILAVGDNLLVLRQLGQTRLQRIERDVKGTREMAERKLIPGRTSSSVTVPTFRDASSSFSTGASAPRAPK